MAWDENELRQLGLTPPSMRQAIPDAPQDVATVLEPALRGTPDAEAIVGRHARFTFRQLDQAVNAAAAFLQTLGLKSGDRIAASIANGTDIVIAFLASQRLGAIWVGINRNYAQGEKAYFIRDAGVSVYLADKDTAAQLEPLKTEFGDLTVVVVQPGEESQWSRALLTHAAAPRPQVVIDPFAPAAIAYTSGTTGFPKGAVHSQHNIMVSATFTEHMAGDRRPGVTRGTSSPLTILNIMIGGPIATLSRGVRQVCMDRIDVAGIVEWVKQERINTLNLVPTLVYDLLTLPNIDQNDLRSLTWMVVGAALVPARLPLLYLERFGHRMTIGYGLTENPTAVTRSDDKTEGTEGAIGKPLPHLHVAILDEAGVEVARGEIGEICVRAIEHGPWKDVYTPTLGYWKRRAATDEVLRGGWLHTGDLGSMDEHGQVFIRSRRSDLILRGGANIYPAEIERVLREDPRVVDCAVIGKPDSRLGECPVAFIQAAAGNATQALIEDLKLRCQPRIAKYKIPVDWFFIDQLPRNTMGKIVRSQLRDRIPAAAPLTATK